jgi:hypothetical protein
LDITEPEASAQDHAVVDCDDDACPGDAEVLPKRVDVLSDSFDTDTIDYPACCLFRSHLTTESCHRNSRYPRMKRIKRMNHAVLFHMNPFHPFHLRIVSQAMAVPE